MLCTRCRSSNTRKATAYWQCLSCRNEWQVPPDDRILDVLGECDSLAPYEVAMALVDQDVAAGEYEGCSTDLEMASEQYERRAATVKALLGHPLQECW